MTTRPSPPFARQRETAEAWEHVRPGRGVLITGGPGAGRTTFARAIVQLAERHGQAPLWSAPTATTRDLPLGALAASVGDLATRDPLGAADIAAAADRLRRHGGSSSTVLVVDDAHLLDQLSAEVVLQAVATRSIALVATMPDDGTLPAGVARLVVDGFVHTVALAALPRAEFEELTATLLGGPVAGATAELLWRWSEGVPHVAAAIVEAGRVAGKFHPIAGRWWWRGATSVPDRPAARLDRPLDAGASVSAEEADAALDLIAVAGPIELDRVERLVDLDVLTTLERGGLIATADDQGATVVRCRGPLVARQRVRSIGALRRRRAARRLLDAVQARSSPSELVRRAVWHVDGDLPAPPDVLRRAESVARLTDPAVAHRLAAADQRWNGGVGALVALVETHLESGEPHAARAALAHGEQWGGSCARRS